MQSYTLCSIITIIPLSANEISFPVCPFSHQCRLYLPAFLSLLAGLWVVSILQVRKQKMVDTEYKGAETIGSQALQVLYGGIPWKKMFGICHLFISHFHNTC